MDRTKGSVSAIAGFCLLWSLILFIAAVTVYNLAGDRGLMTVEMRRYSSPETSGLPDEEYPEMGKMIAEYLTGRRDTFQYTYRDQDKKEITCFQPHEAEHMADCRRLIRTAGILRWILAGVSLFFFVICLAARDHRKAFLKGIITGSWVAAAAFAALLIWGLVNFDGLFITFHRIAFSNDGWLLDPRTDMLIRLMPTAFFTDLGSRVLIAVAVMILALFSAAKTILMAIGKSEQEAHRMENAVCEA